MNKKIIIPVVAACIVQRHPTRLLLHQRNEAHDERGIARNPELCGKWEFAGGMMEYGETPEQALGREIREELSLTISVLKLLHAQSSLYADRKHYLVLYYECQTSYQSTPDGCLWVSPKDIPEMDCLPTTYFIAKRFFREAR